MTLTQVTKAGLHDIALDHVFTIGASGSDHYTFQGEGLNGTVNDPTLYLTRGKTYRFENGSGGHPIRIQSTSGASGTAYNTGVTNNAGSGTVIVEVQHDAPDVLYYQCTSHANMNGVLYITGALADGGVTTAKLADSNVTTAKIADSNVTTAKIADDAVTDAKLANSINSAIAANTAKNTNATHTGDVTGSGSLTIASNAVTTAKIADDAVTGAKIADDAVDTAQIADNAVITAQIADNQVTGAKIADDAVDTAQIANNAVVTAQIANSQITTDKIADGAVAQAKIGANAVTTAKISDAQITTAKIVDGAVGTGKIADDAVTNAKIDSMAASKLTGALPAISGAALTGIAGGITEADTWVVHSDFSDDNVQPITSNWSRVSYSLSMSNKLGTGMSQSSGVFSFPSTGYYLIIFKAVYWDNSANDYMRAYIEATPDNGSNYHNIALARTSNAHQNPPGMNWEAEMIALGILDVQNTSNYKVRFNVQAGQNVYWQGDSGRVDTGAYFIRLGDT